MSAQKTVKANGVDLCIETFGQRSDPAILLIMGAAASMDWWPAPFCQRLADRRRHVVRYDLRDTGESVTYEPGAPAYTGADLMRDAVGLLNVLGIRSAHIVGLSAGGGIAQHLAVDHPDRVASLTLISTAAVEPTPTSSTRVESHDEPSTPEPEVDWSDRKAVFDFMFNDARQIQGSVHTDEEDLRSLIDRVIDRTKNIQSSNTNHWILQDGDFGEVQLERIDVPTLVIHGTEDPLIPVQYGEALAAAIPGARLVTLDGVGHGDLPPAVWHTVISEILDVSSN